MSDSLQYAISWPGFVNSKIIGSHRETIDYANVMYYTITPEL